ncbi:MAG: hypothetical protein WCT05_13980, partial [Lentisphaeria bacterium]
TVGSARIVFDSDLNRKGQGACSYHWEKNILSNFPLHQPPRRPPATLVRSFRLEARQADGSWQEFYREENNYQRLVRLDFTLETDAVRLIPESTWGAERCKLFAFELGENG